MGMQLSSLSIEARVENSAIKRRKKYSGYTQR